jgi:hypothetical protein
VASLGGRLGTLLDVHCERVVYEKVGTPEMDSLFGVQT